MPNILKQKVTKNNISKYEKLLKSTKLTIGSLATIFTLCQPIKAKGLDLISPNNTNSIISPAYWFFPWNIWNNILSDEDLKKIENNPKTKKFFKESLKLIEKNTGIKDKEKLKKINIDIIKLLILAYNKKIDGEKFLFDFLDLSKKYNIKETNLINLISDYIKKGYIPAYTIESFKKQLDISYQGLINFYGKKELVKKLNQAKELYTNGELTKESIKTIFADYIEEKNLTNKLSEIFFLIILLTFILGISVPTVVILTIKEK